ncbi:transposase [Streptomyces cyaneofuscatus]|uniref:transposase n=1 Tax=Streptomyces cyaneofuscatus TaxID=66883 RepID=UPI003788219A
MGVGRGEPAVRCRVGVRPLPARDVAGAEPAGRPRTEWWTGTAWRDVPERYGPWATAHTRFRREAMDGTFELMLRAAQAKADAAGRHRVAGVGRLDNRLS